LLLRSVSVSWALGLDAVVFGLWHAVLQYNGFAGQRSMVRLTATGGGTAAYALLGLLLALVRQAAGGLLAAIVAHGVLDVLMFAGMYVRRRQLRAMAGGARTA
jgi:membrane protease YdiL (CAAX protease family)